jgi:Holliday junction resolvase RusA-like endonuclease
MKTAFFIVDGEPKGKARPRVLKSGIAYTPKETVAYENYVKLCFRESKNEMLDGMIEADIKAFFQIPKSASGKKAAQMRNGDIRPTKKPDIDNIVKAILDSLNGIAYKDDSMIVGATVEKYFSDKPRVEVELREYVKEEKKDGKRD